MTAKETAQKTGEVLSLFGQSGWPGVLANLGAVGVICWLVIVELPAQRQQFREDIGQVRDATQSELRALQDRYEARLDRLEASRERQQTEFLTNLDKIRASMIERDRWLADALRLQGKALDGLTNELRRMQGLPPKPPMPMPEEEES